jgi:hypothetical protein
MIAQSLLILLSIAILEFDGDSWTAPGWRVTEEWRIDPYEYVEDGEPSRGIATCETDGSWKLTLVDENDAYVIHQDGSVDRFPFDFDIESIRFSPNAEYCVMWDIYTDQFGRLDLSSGDFRLVSPFQDPGGLSYRWPKIRITDSGSVVLLHSRFLRIFDPDLNLVLSNDDHFPTNSSIGYSNNGELICVTNGDQVDAYDSEGSYLWTVDAQLIAMTQWGKVFVAQDGSTVLLTHDDNGEVSILDGESGIRIRNIDLTGTFAGDAKYSSNGDYVAFSRSESDRATDIRTVSAVLLANIHDEQDQTEFSFTYEAYQSIWMHKLRDVGNNGCQLYHFSKRQGPLKYVVYSADSEIIHCTNWIQSAGSTSQHLEFYAYLSDDGEGFCYFDGSNIVFETLERE